jgi:hypothetical protein
MFELRKSILGKCLALRSLVIKLTWASEKLPSLLTNHCITKSCDSFKTQATRIFVH